MAGFDTAYVVTYYWLLSTHRGLRQLAMATLLAWSCALNFHSWNEAIIFWLPDPLPMWQDSQSGKPVSPRLSCTQNLYLVHWSVHSFIWRWLLFFDNNVLSVLKWDPLTFVGMYSKKNTFLNRVQGRHDWLLRRAKSAFRGFPRNAVPKDSSHNWLTSWHASSCQLLYITARGQVENYLVQCVLGPRTSPWSHRKIVYGSGLGLNEKKPTKNIKLDP